MKLTPEDIENLGTLSRISLSENEKETLGRECSAILDYVSRLEGGSLELSQVYVGEKNIFREDVVASSGEQAKNLVSLSPRTKNGFVEVVKVLGDND